MPMSFSHELNSTDVSIGATVLVSCPADQVFEDNSEISNVTTTCMANGAWNPSIANCKGTLYASLNKSTSMHPHNELHQ